MNTTNGQEITKIDKNCMKRTKSTLLGQHWVVTWEISKPIFWLVRGKGGSSPSPPATLSIRTKLKKAVYILMNKLRPVKKILVQMNDWEECIFGKLAENLRRYVKRDLIDSSLSKETSQRSTAEENCGKLTHILVCLKSLKKPLPTENFNINNKGVTASKYFLV